MAKTSLEFRRKMRAVDAKIDKLKQTKESAQMELRKAMAEKKTMRGMTK